jgi:hypothetical protein
VLRVRVADRGVTPGRPRAGRRSRSESTPKKVSLLCLIGRHRWMVDVDSHALSVLRAGRIVADCSRCGVWSPFEVKAGKLKKRDVPDARN